MLRRTTLFLLLIFTAGLVASENTLPQDKWWKEKKYKSESVKAKYDLCRKTFVDIGAGLDYKNVSLIIAYFDSQVYLNITGNEKGYYSPGQAELILQDFMDDFPVLDFKYIRSNRFNTYAFANGDYTYYVGSGKKKFKVAVSLKYSGSVWLVDQISIN